MAARRGCAGPNAMKTHEPSGSKAEPTGTGSGLHGFLEAAGMWAPPRGPGGASHMSEGKGHTRPPRLRWHMVPSRPPCKPNGLRFQGPGPQCPGERCPQRLWATAPRGGDREAAASPGVNQGAQGSAHRTSQASCQNLGVSGFRLRGAAMGIKAGGVTQHGGPARTEAGAAPGTGRATGP